MAEQCGHEIVVLPYAGLDSRELYVHRDCLCKDTQGELITCTGWGGRDGHAKYLSVLFLNKIIVNLNKAKLQTIYIILIKTNTNYKEF